MKVEPAFVGARGIDSLPFSQGGTAAQATALKEAGIDFMVGYLGAMNPSRLGYLLDAGIAFMAVTYAGAFFNGGSDELAQLKSLGVPPGVTVWLDLEGKKSYETPPQQLISLNNDWAKMMQNAGYIAGLYVGSPQPLTGDELARLAFSRYWKAPSRVLDRAGKAWDGPSGIGFCMWQMWPQGMWRDTGVFVDVNIIGQDFRGRVPSWLAPG